jgi:nicotinamide-nucleotide amidase
MRVTASFELCAQVGQLLRAKGWRIACAESCTGGGIAQALTNVPGSSEWFECGLVAYSNASKTQLLEVPAELIARHGAVSEAVAAAMAQGAAVVAKAQIALSTTGIAGPGGAMPGKPVGTVCFGWRINDRTVTQTLLFEGNRETVRAQSVTHALQELLVLVGQ